MKRLVFAVGVLLMAAHAAPAHAVWGGEPDGNQHPSVGAMYFDFLGGEIVADGLMCSGSYAGPSKDGQHDVFLTAGHCLPPAELGIPASLLAVSFDNNAGDGVDAPIWVEEYHQMPGFGGNVGDPKDLGVLLLPAGSVAANFGSIPAVSLPTAGYLDDLKASGELNFKVADIVGYGVQPVWNEPGRTSFGFDGLRRSGTTVVTGLTRSQLLYNQNRHGIGTGSGVCFGDSGSPQFEQGTLLVISVTSGGNGQCNANNSNYRVDTKGARAFLGQFLDLP